MQTGSSASNCGHEAALRDYAALRLQPLLNSITEACLLQRPDNPTEFLRRWFNDGCPSLSSAPARTELSAENCRCGCDELPEGAGANTPRVDRSSVAPILQLSSQLNERVQQLRRASLERDVLLLPAAEAARSLGSYGAVDDAMVRGFLWRDGEVLKAVFARHAAPSGALDCEALPCALDDAFRLFGSTASHANAAAAAAAAAATGRPSLTLEEFRELVCCSSAVEGHVNRSAVARVIADVICADCASEAASLIAFSQLSQESLARAITAAVPGLLIALSDAQACVNRAISKSDRATASADSSKFHTNKMACGSIADFHRGLTARIGAVAPCRPRRQVEP
jgi:hypothetical protein